MRLKPIPVGLALLSAGCAGSTGGSPYGTKWDLAADFSTVSNPGSTWSYGEQGTAAFTLESTLGYNLGPAWGGLISVNKTGVNEFGVAPNAADFNAATATPDARWKAPFAGTFNVTVEIGGPTGSGNAAASAGQVLVNGVAQSQTSFTNNVATFTLTDVVLAKGGTVDVQITETAKATNNQVVFTVQQVE